MSKKQPDRPTIGFLTTNVNTGTALLVLEGVLDAARNYDVNLICFAGQSLRATDKLQSQANIIFELVSDKHLDGLLYWAPSVGRYLDEVENLAFIQKFNLPVVSLGALPGTPMILVDSPLGMQQAIQHLIDVHRRRHVAFVSGPQKHPAAQNRFQAYCTTLDAHQIPFDANLVTPPGSWHKATGAQAIATLLDERGLQPGKDFDAIAAASDVLALGAMQALQKRGIKIPEDVALIGFNDSLAGQMASPALTSVATPLHEEGVEGIAMLLELLAGNKTPEKRSLSARPIIRQSCGCLDEAVARAGTYNVGQKAGKAIQARREKILQAIQQSAPAGAMADVTQAEVLLDALHQAIEQKNPSVFLAALREATNYEGLTQPHATAWQNVLSELQHYAIQNAAPQDALLLFAQARTLLADAAAHAQMTQQLQTEALARDLNRLGALLITTFDAPQLITILDREMPKFDLPGCYLTLYENPQPYHYPQPAPEWSYLVLAYNEESHLPLPAEGLRFPTRDLLPPGALPANHRYTLIVQPLHFQETQIGVVMFEIGPQNWQVYETLRNRICTALQGALLVQQVKQRVLQLETSAEVAHSVSDVLDVEEIMQHVVALVQKRFNLYYVGLFLQSADQAVLRMGSGEPGRRMIEQNFRFSIKGESAVARCINTRQPCCVESKAEAYPLLPDSHIELALPLITRGKVIGALSIHATQTQTFESTEITVFETLAGQLANAIENARAYDAIRELSKKLQVENLRITSQLAVTQRLQRMLLPTEEELRRIKALDIAGFMQPAEEIGGDYYDVLYHNGKIKFGIGDVTGHGLESGVVMLMLQTAVRTLLISEEQDPLRILTLLNRLLHDNLQRMQAERTMSLTLLDYEPQPHPQVRVSGQHESFLLVHRDGQVAVQDTQNLGFPLGLVDNVSEFAHEMTLPLKPGDGLVLYSDGVTEAANAAGELYGLDRLCGVVSHHWNNSATEIKATIVSDIHAFIGQHTIYDDITFLIVKQR